MKQIIKSIFKFLSNLNCRSKCCSGTECDCKSNQNHPESFVRIDPKLPLTSSNLRKLTRFSSI